MLDNNPSLLSLLGVPLHHSRPGSPRILYLDFDGHTQATTKGWAPFSAIAFDPMKNGPAFDDEELARISLIWQRVAEDYIVFDVDVTTEAPPKFNATVARCLITRSTDANGKNMPNKNAGGIAYINIWGSGQLQKYGPALGEFGGGGKERETER